MIIIQGGMFTMMTVLDGDPEETPYQVSVTLSSYEMARNETTIWQYNLFAVATGKKLEIPSWGIWGNNPIIYTTWYNAINYCNWVSIRMNLQPSYNIDNGNESKIIWQSNANGFRLPTDAEFDFATKGGN